MRIIRACRSLGVPTVAVHSEADAQALHVRFADEAVCIGPAEARKSYLNVPALLAAAEITGADAIHPGYGFLSENPEFADICQRCRIAFIGPTAAAMRLWGDKVSAREQAKLFGLPLLEGSQALRDADAAERAAERIGYPIILKAAGGGGGRGMRVVTEKGALRSSFDLARREAEQAFKNGDIFMERFVQRPKHIEFQVLADSHGSVWTLGERECSLQRRHQKVMEESPSGAVSPALRAMMGERIREAMVRTGYTGLGTLEFLMDERGDLFFLEMNTRLQVEHPVTEAVTGIDLVMLQIQVAAGEAISLPDTRPWAFRGHSIECRINAEDPWTLRPSPGLITEYHPPGGGGVRVDSGVYAGFVVPAHYDSLLSKVIVHAPNRAEAIAKMRVALGEYVVGGVTTNIALHQALLTDHEVIAGTMSTRTVERVIQERVP